MYIRRGGKGKGTGNGEAEGNRQGNLHLRIEDAGVWLHDADCLIERLNRMSRAVFVGDHGREIELEILGLQIGGETVADAVLFAGRYLDVVASCRQVADNLG